MTGFVIIMAEQIGLLWKKLHAVSFGVYGATKVGKTTLHHQLRTRGEVPTIKERTVEKQSKLMATNTQLEHRI